MGISDSAIFFIFAVSCDQGFRVKFQSMSNNGVQGVCGTITLTEIGSNMTQWVTSATQSVAASSLESI